MTQVDSSSMTPEQYLRFVQAAAEKSQLDRFRRNDEVSGLRTESVSGIPYAQIEDEGRYRRFLETSRHLTTHDVDQILVKEKEAEKLFLEGLAQYSTRLLNADEFAKSLLRQEATKLVGVPLGVAPLTYLYGGAMPVPAGGNIVVISVSFFSLLYWMTWISLLLQGLKDTKHLRRLCAALPDLARHIVGDSPATGQFMYFGWSVVGSDALTDDKTNRRVWLAEVFLILHEYAHILKGHTDAMRDWIPEESLREEQLLERRELQRRLEFEADAFAADALKGVLFSPPLDPGTVYEEVIDALNRLFLLFHFAESESHAAPKGSTHPPAVERWKRVLVTYVDDTPTTEDQIDEIVRTYMAIYHVATEIRLQDR
jgi:hypothetical protein